MTARLLLACVLPGCLLLAPGCGAPADAPPPMSPLGGRAIRLHDGQPLRHYGPGKGPVVRVQGEPGPWRLALGEQRLETRVERVDAHVFLVAEAPEALPPGPALLRVVHDDRTLVAWPAWWSPSTAGPMATVENTVRRLGHAGWGAAEMIGWRLVAALDRALDRPTEAARALRFAARRARQRGQFAEARALIEQSDALDESVGFAAGQAYAAHARAGLEFVAGALGPAEAAAADAVRLSRAAWLPALSHYGLMLRAVIDSALGRHARARARLDGLAEQVEAMSPDLRLMYEGNRGWILFEGRRQGAFDVDPAEIEAAFVAALSLAEGRPDEQANQHANLAALARMTGDRAALDRHIAAHDRFDTDRREQPGLFVGLLDGHRALLDGDGALARARFDEVERRLLTRVDDPMGAYLWQARLGRARALELLGDGPGALAAYRDALAIVERAASRTALQGQRALFFAEQDALFEEAFAAALAQRDTAAAFTIADAARARVVRDLEVQARLGRLDDTQRAAWSARVERYLTLRALYERERTAGELMAADRRGRWQAQRAQQRAELQAAFDAAYDWLDRVAPVTAGGATVAAVQARLAADEGLWLAHHRGDGWHGFLITANGFDHRVGEGPLPDRLPDGIAHLALVGVPPAQSPQLWDRVSTAVWTHAGALRRPRAPGAGPRIVIGDPDQSLPGARREAEAIAAVLGGRLLRGAAVDRAAARRALVEASALHFAGHGVLVPASPWDAHLRLADGQRLTTEDVLMAPVRPRLVVLSSCEIGRAAPLAARISLSLADALVAAGAGSVVAAERPIPDATALALMRRFYAAGGLENPAEALRRAALATRDAGDPLWDAFQLHGAR